MSLNTNAAFPIPDSNPYAKGLTKREIFAMAAMQGMLSALDASGLTYLNASYTAEGAVALADALLAALEQPA